jgi:hypothetical protein
VNAIVPEEDEADWLTVAAAVFLLAEEPGRAGPAAGGLLEERQAGPGQPGR